MKITIGLSHRTRVPSVFRLRLPSGPSAGLVEGGLKYKWESRPGEELVRAHRLTGTWVSDPADHCGSSLNPSGSQHVVCWGARRCFEITLVRSRGGNARAILQDFNVWCGG